jgi:hypothetical protein
MTASSNGRRHVRHTPRHVAVVAGTTGRSYQANRAALAAMSESERICGATVEQLDAFHASERARVWAAIAESRMTHDVEAA